MKKRTKKKLLALALLLCVAALLWFFLSPGKHSRPITMEEMKPVGPAFNADSAYYYVERQCSFGPRTMNSPAHEQCKEWIAAQFRQMGCEVTLQEATLTGYDGTQLASTNIIARHQPDRSRRILICAHWDSRPWADNDPDSANWRKPVMAANDGASGIGVMLELARLLRLAGDSLAVGVDFVCFDAEDWGTPQWAEQTTDGDPWALGAQWFATHLPQNFNVEYGILLDMVGGQGARFHHEGYSSRYAPAIIDKVWKAARQTGYGSHFVSSAGGAVTDDHVPLNTQAGIPTIDIIPYYPDCPQSSFGPTWHTVNDDMSHIDRATLKVVGQTLIQTLFTE